MAMNGNADGNGNENEQPYHLGKLLIELRLGCSRGEWIKLLRRYSLAFNRPLSQPTAWRYMRYARDADARREKVER